MLDRLIASAPPRAWSLPGTIASVAFHAVVVYVAVQATVGTGKGVSAAAADTMLVFIQPEASQRAEPEPQVQTVELPGGFKTIVAPVAIPTDIPPVDVRQTFDPRDYTGVGAEKAADAAIGATTEPGPNAAYAESAVDEKPEIISSPPLQYPDVLHMAGIEGSVLVEAIVDTSGRAEPGSVRVVNSSHPGFEKEAMAVVAKSIYRPGRMRGQVVRVLVNVPVSFTIRKRMA